MQAKYENSSSDVKTVPSKIHFIWVGGAIPEKYLKKLQQIAKTAELSGFEINLWVDNEMNYIKTSVNSGIDIPNLNLRNVNELKSQMREDPFYQEDDRFIKFWEYVGRERVGFKNLAAAADLLRFEIIRQHGGYYFDTDIDFILDEKSRFIADEIPLGIKAHIDVGISLANSDFNDPLYMARVNDTNNDIIAAEPYHTVLEQTIQNAMEYYENYDSETLPANYQRRFGQYATVMDAKRSPYQPPINFRREYTINAGPGALMEALREYVASMRDSVTRFMTLKVGTENVTSTQPKEILGVSVLTKCDKNWLNKIPKSAQKAFESGDVRFSPEMSQTEEQFEQDEIEDQQDSVSDDGSKETINLDTPGEKEAGIPAAEKQQSAHNRQNSDRFFAKAEARPLPVYTANNDSSCVMY